MNRNEWNATENGNAPLNVGTTAEPDLKEWPREQPPAPPEVEGLETPPETAPVEGYASRAGLKGTAGMEKNKLILLGGGLLLAVLFFVFTAVVGRSPVKGKPGQRLPSAPEQPQNSGQTKGSVTPLMEAVRTPTQENTGGQINANDIERTRSATGGANQGIPGVKDRKPSASTPVSSNSLGSVPSFADTQQKWEEPAPYGKSTSSASSTQPMQQQNALKEPSLVFVRSAVHDQPVSSAPPASLEDTTPVLDLTPGTRVEAKLETQISSAVQAPVVAVIEYTYALGDRTIIPAGARVYGHLEQADRSGYVSVKFDEIELLDGAREKIEAIGTDLNLGPIKGNVFGKNTGRNFLVRAASGLGSVAAMLVGNNSSAAFSEDDMLRERVAENIGEAGDSEVMNMAMTSRVVVSVPADTKIYVVFTRHEQTPAILHRVSSTKP